MARYYFTEKGYHKLQDEIEKLEKFIKQDIAKEIATAREHGDLKENAEYAAAKDKQTTNMAKLNQLQERISNADVIRQGELPADIITLGKQVRMKDVDTGDELQYAIMGEGETDIDRGIISYQSPLAKALMTHKKGDVVEAQLPRGLRKFEILKIEYFDED